jgi:hypothetical protein
MSGVVCVRGVMEMEYICEDIGIRYIFNSYV